MPDYKTNDPRGWCGDPKRGAALGRHDVHGPEAFGGKLYLRRVYLDQGGYDSNGTYFGHGEPLYWAANESGRGQPEIDFVLRAADRRFARLKVLQRYPAAKVRR